MRDPELTSSLIPLVALGLGMLLGAAGIVLARRGVELAVATFLAIVLCIGHGIAGEVTIARARTAAMSDPTLTPADQANRVEWLDAQAGGRLVTDGGSAVVLFLFGGGALLRGLHHRRNATSEALR